MGRATHTRMLLVMELIHDGMTPAEAAKTVGVALSTLYRSKLYKEWRDAQTSRN